MSEVTIIIPILNEQDNILSMYQSLKALNLVDYEIIWVDDGSTDYSFQKIKEICTADKQSKCISFSRNFGHQYALLAGMKVAKGNIIVHIDGDLQQPASLITTMISKINEGYDIVTTKRIRTEKSSLLKTVFAKIFYRLINFLSETRITENAADFRAFNKKILTRVLKFQEQHIFWRGIFDWVGYKRFGLAYTANHRESGKTKYTFRRMFSLARFGITSFSLKPLRLALTLGLFISFFAFAFGIYALITYINGRIVSGWTSIIITSMIIGGVQLLVVGILGEYIGNIYREVLKRPKYLINDTVNIDDDEGL